MKGMHFIVIEDGAIAGTGVVKQGVGNDKYLCEFPQTTGIRLSRIMPADSMIDWLFFNNQNSLQAYMQTQMPAKPEPEESEGDEGLVDDEAQLQDKEEVPGTPDDTPATTTGEPDYKELPADAKDPLDE